MRTTFFTVDGIENEYPPNHPLVLKFTSKELAERWIEFCSSLGVEMESAVVRENSVSILTEDEQRAIAEYEK